MKPLLRILIVVLVAFPEYGFAQIEFSRDVYSSSGGEFNAGQLRIGFTIGETLTSTMINSEVHTLGFEQPDDITSSLEELSISEIQLYPNPANEIIIIESENLTNINYSILDEVGRVIISGKSISGDEINVSNLEPGNYNLRIHDDNNGQIVKPFIIVKP